MDVVGLMWACPKWNTHTSWTLHSQLEANRSKAMVAAGALRRMLQVGEVL